MERSTHGMAMDPNPERLEALFEAARHLRSDAERDAYLDRACVNDPALRREIEAMLASEAAADDYFRTADVPGEVVREVARKRTPSAAVEPPAEGPGIVIGRYKLLQQIGEGGFGVVYMAEQQEPVVRKVALKIIKLGLDTREVVARFEAERQALALMDHPNIAKVLDGGATETGRPYFVMELVKGIPVTRFCDENHLTTRRRLDLFVDICSAIQHAHQKGVIHRDLKPSNILVTLHGDKPVPMVIDFGIAKATARRLTDKTLFTQFQQFLGTPAYMSPEQASLSALDVDTRCDIYSLGVLLYELLTSRTPFESQTLVSAGLEEMRRMIREEEPPRPSVRLSTLRGEEQTTVAKARQVEPNRLRGLIRGELDWIVMKALEKDRARRYETASGLAMDIQRYLNDEPVLAVAPSARYRVTKFVRRHRAGLGVTAALFAILVAGVGVSVWQMVRARQAEKAAVAARGQAETVSEFLVEAFRSPDPERDGRTVTVAEVLDRATTNLVGRFEGAPERKAALLQALGETYLGLGLYHEAKRLIQESLQLRQQVLGPKNPATLETMLRLVDLLRLQDRLVEADELGKRSLELHREILGVGHTNTLAAMRGSAEIDMHLGRASEAEALLSEAARRYRQVLGPEAPATLECLSDLAVAYDLQDRASEAEKLYLETLATMRRVLGTAPQTLGVINNLGDLYREKLNRPADAERLFREALAMGNELLGPEHPTTLTAMNNLALACQALGNSEEAERLYRQALEHLRRGLGPEHRSTLTVMQNLARLCNDLGRFPEAEQLARTLLETERGLSGHDSRATLEAMSFLGLIDLGANRLTEAEELFDQLRDLWRRTLGPERRETLVATHNLAWVYANQNRLKEAEGLHQESLEAMRRVLGPADPDTLKSMNGLSSVYVNQGRFLEATKLFAEVLEIRRRILGSENPETLGAMSNLAIVHERQGHWAAAEPLCRERLEFQRRLLGQEDPVTLLTLDNLAYVCARQGRFADAEALYAEALQTRQSQTNTPPDAIHDLAANLRQVLYQQSKFDQIESLERDLLAYWRERTPANSGRLASVLDERIATLLEIEKFGEAEAVARECLAIREREDAEGWLTAGTRCQVAASLIGQNQFAEAEPLLRSAYESLKSQWPTSPRSRRSRLAEARLLLARLDAATGRTNEIAALTAENLAELNLPVPAPQMTPRQVDLSLYYNAALNESWHEPPGGQRQNNLAALPTGLHELAGTPFDLRGIVQLDHGPRAEANRDYFRRVEQIPVRQRALKLHFLHACGWGRQSSVDADGHRLVVEAAAHGSLVGRYVVRYADGQRRDIPIRLGREVAEWWHWPESPPDSEDLTIAWTGTNAAAAQQNAQVRLFKMTWENPLPEVEIRSLDYVSAMAGPAPFLIAVTTE